MSELSVATLNAEEGFGDPIREDDCFALVENLSKVLHPSIWYIGELASLNALGSVDLADIERVRERFARAGYDRVEIAEETNVAGERNASYIAMALRDDVEPGATLVTRRYGRRNGIKASLPTQNLTVVGLHLSDHDEDQRVASTKDVIADVAPSLVGSQSDEAYEGEPKVVIMGDFNSLSPDNQHSQTRVLRFMLHYVGLGKPEFDFYKPRFWGRLAGFAVRAVRMSEGRARGLLDDHDYHHANTVSDPTCHHRGVSLAIDDIYATPNVQFTKFERHEPRRSDGKRVSDHDCLVATLQFAGD
jgi:endonuclease/exonuclease/phosphatase family metal-dependent hydrolase